MKAFALIAVVAQTISWDLPRAQGLEDIANRYVADHGRVAVAVAKPTYRSLPVQSKGASLAELGERIRKRLALAPGRFGGFATSAWSGHLVMRQNTSDHPKPNERESTLLGFKWERGLLTGRTEPGLSVEASRINELGFTRPVRFHWFFQSIPIHLISSQASEAEVVSTLAEALGAELRVADKAYEIEPSASLFRERLIATYAEQASSRDHDRFTQAKYRVAAAALRRAKDEEVQRLYARPGQELLITSGDPAMGEDIEVVLNEYFAQLAPEAKSNDSVRQAVTFYRDRIDFRAPRALIIRSVGGVLIRLRGLKPTEVFDL
jgi:hypothetical protein